jgi:hypothetical protein
MDLGGSGLFGRWIWLDCPGGPMSRLPETRSLLDDASRAGPWLAFADFSVRLLPSLRGFWQTAELAGWAKSSVRVGNHVDTAACEPYRLALLLR